LEFARDAAETVRRFTLRVFEQGHEVDHMGTRRIGRMNGATEADTD
jgi:hypothetical protein